MPATLLVRAPAPPEVEPVTRLGGRPLLPPGTAWPRCRTCAGPMQLVGQLGLAELLEGADGLLALFLCVNDPGGCDTAFHGSGGNVALLARPGAPLALHDPPAGQDEVTRLGETAGVTLRASAGGYFGASDGDLAILGGAGGAPEWLQADETPDCSCGRAMRFVAQLEARLARMDFYVFVSTCCGEARWLWQCC